MANKLWIFGFYSHIYFSGIALLVGWLQFNGKLRKTKLKLHRTIGKIYVVIALIGSISGISIGFYATGGIISILGFVILGVIWFYTTLKAFVHVRKGNIIGHQNMMIFSYAACFAAVTLRIWLPILVVIYGEFIGAYQTVAWLCWVPNIIVAWYIVKSLPTTNNRSTPVFK